MRVALFSRPLRDDALPVVVAIVDALLAGRAAVCLHTDLQAQLAPLHAGAAALPAFTTHDEVTAMAEVLISVGGDGTLLDTVALVRDALLPVLGVNLGRLGFLASLGRDGLKEGLSQLLEGDFTVEKRTMLAFSAEGLETEELAPPYALNEFVVHKSDFGGMASIRASLDGEFLNTFWADGLIVSTPTGSTGYSLSCGGPIVLPQSQNWVITPIAPHNLGVRPMVVPDSTTITLEVIDRAGPPRISVDARNAVHTAGGPITLSRSAVQFPLVRLSGESSLQTLRNKLLWGLDTRNY